MNCSKRITAGLISVFMIINFTSSLAIADGELDDSVAASLSTEVPAKSYILMEASTGKVLEEQNSDEQMAPASVTKIMVMLLLMEQIDAGVISFDDMVTTSENAASMGGSQIWLEIGEEMSVNDLLKATAVNSANDAAVSLGEYIGGSEENFVTMMNEKANELGMINTVFKNASGLDAEGHLSTARDIAIMSSELLKHEEITKYTSIWMDTLRGGETELTNTNKLVRYYDGCTGLKTGTTDEAGSCISATATKEGMTLIAVTMGSETSADRFSAARALLDYGFNTYCLFTPEIKFDDVPEIRVINGEKSSLEVDLPASNSVVVPKAEQAAIEYSVEVMQDIEAPIEQGNQVGTIIFTLNGDTIEEYPITAAEDINALSFNFVFIRLFQLFFSIA